MLRNAEHRTPTFRPDPNPITFGSTVDVVQSSWFRRVAAIGAVCVFFAGAMLVLWSDRAVPYFGSATEVLLHTGRSVEQRFDVNVPGGAFVTDESDQIAHALLWGSGMMLIGWVTRQRFRLVHSVLSMATISLLFEIAQPAVSARRAIEPSDMVANLVGIALAAMVVGAATVLWRRGGAAS